MDMFIDLNISFKLLFISSSEWRWTKLNRKTNQPTWPRPFLSFRHFSIKIDKINRLIAEIDNHKNLTDRFPIDKFWLITIDFSRVSKISICYFQIMYKSKLIKIRITVSPRQKWTICGQISLPRVPISWKGTTLPVNVKGVLEGGTSREAGHGVGIWHFSKICCQIPCPQANHSSQMHQNFLELISFIRVATVREKSGKNKNFSRSGKSQGIF